MVSALLARWRIHFRQPLARAKRCSLPQFATASQIAEHGRRAQAMQTQPARGCRPDPQILGWGCRISTALLFLFLGACQKASAHSSTLPALERSGASAQFKISAPRPADLGTNGPLASAMAAPVDPCGKYAPPPLATDALIKPWLTNPPAQVTFGEFWSALGVLLGALDPKPLRPEYEAFAKRHGIDPATPELWSQFTRLRWLFEATRDGGWWQLRWDITNQEPSSQKIWAAWIKQTPAHAFDAASAVAECDEVTSLFAVAAKRVGIRGVGLYYPRWNHTIAAWAPQGLPRQQKTPVVLVPTTQIFLGCADTFDQTTFKTSLTSIQEYPFKDVRDDAKMPRALAWYLLGQVRAYGEASPDLLALIRARRARAVGSAMGDCSAYRGELRARVQAGLTCADRFALNHLVTQELHRTAMSPEAALDWLAEPGRDK